MSIGSIFGKQRLCDAAEIIISNVDKIIDPSEGPVRLCNYTDVYYNNYIRDGLTFMPGTASVSEIKKFSLKKGDVIITKDSESSDDIAVPSLVAEDLTNVVCGYHLAIIRPNQTITLGEYLLHLLEDESIRYYFFTLSNGVTRYGLTSGAISHALLPLPPLPEQKKIAEILGACDEAIEAQERLIAQKQQRKKGLMQKLLTGEVRFPDFEGTAWGEVRLGDVFKERKETKREDLELLAVTGNGGVVKRDGLNRKDTSSEDKSKYKRVCPGDIAYNTMRMWQGVSGLSKFEGIVSPAYTIVKPDSELDPTFSAYFFKLPEIISLFHRFSQGLVNDTLNLKYQNFKVIKVTIPERLEQELIGRALAVSDEEITLQQTKLEQLKQQKKGLMQQLLTGKVRVKV